MTSREIAWTALAIAVLRDRYTTPDGALDLAEGVPPHVVENAERQRMVELAMMYKPTMTYAEIGEVLGVNKFTVYKYITTARKAGLLPAHQPSSL